MAEPAAVRTRRAYEILNVPPGSSSTQVREAYFCLRYDIYRRLSDDDRPGEGGKMTPAERRSVERRMDAVAAAFRMLSDPAERIRRDAGSTGEDFEDFKDSERAGARANRSVFRRGKPKPKPVAAAEPSGKKAETVASFRRRSVGRRPEADSGGRRDSLFGGGREDSALEGGAASLGSRASAGSKSASTLKSDNLFAPSPAFSPRLDDDTGDFAGRASNNGDFTSFPPSSQIQNLYQEHLPVGVNDLNMRGQMIYKNQMFVRQNDGAGGGNGGNGGGGGMVQRSRIAQRYEKEEREDWLGGGEEGDGGDAAADGATADGATADGATADGATADGTAATQEESLPSRTSKKRWSLRRSKQNSISSPTGVEEFDSNTFRSVNKSSFSSKNKSEKKSSRPPSRFSFDDSTNASGYDDERTRDDDTRTTNHDDDDTTNYDEDTTAYDDTTLGDTLDETTMGESCFTEEDDDETFASERVKKYSPGHKKGNRPEPILRGEKYNNAHGAGNKDENRRVVVHSHRGRKGREKDDDFASAVCPFPSIADIREEVRGTCKDASSALHQVLHAFVISPDDIDRMSDKIRDAKVELAENYYRQVNERKRGNSGRELRL